MSLPPVPTNDATALWFAEDPLPADWYRAFEAYGHAMMAASAFEQLMALLLAKAEVFRLGNRENAATTPDEQREITRQRMKWSFAKLENRLCKTFNLSALLREQITIGRDSRDHLAHNYWQAHIHNLWTERGIDVIATTCALAANHYRWLAHTLINETGVNADDYIEMARNDPDMDDKIGGWEAMLAANHMPN